VAVEEPENIHEQEMVVLAVAVVAHMELRLLEVALELVE
jgi:hypothetical protein